jgi:uncharacterized protein (TIGR02145 family)
MDMKRKNRFNICTLILVGLLFIFTNSCKKDGIAEDPNTVTDVDGNVYHTVTIGTQVWMAENLKVTRYRNGDVIGTTNPAFLDISGETSPKYQWVHDGKERNAAIYGRLYTWYAVNDSRSICPKGWHIPTEQDMITLREYLMANGYNYDRTTGGNACAKALASESNWIFSTTKGAVGNTDYPEKRNLTGFNGSPAGLRTPSGIFNDMGTFGAWWSSSVFSTFATKMSLHYSLSLLYVNIYPKETALSVRCLRD